MDANRGVGRAALGIISGITLLSAAAGVAGGVFVPPVPVWAFIGAEVVVGMAAAMGCLWAWRGVGNESPGLTLGLVALAVLFASVIGYVGAGTSSGLPTRPLLGLRAALAAAIAAGAAAAELRSNARAWRDLLLGAAAGVPCLAFLATLALPQGRAALGNLGSLGVVGGFVLATAGFLLLTALTAASVHLVVRAFTGGERAPPPAAGT